MSPASLTALPSRDQLRGQVAARIAEDEAQPPARNVGKSVEDARQKTQARVFRFLPLAEAFTTSTVPDWLVRGYLERDSLSVLFGEPGSMKSFLALDLALCIASGVPWHGAKAARAPVLYIAGEGFRGLIRRILAWGRYWCKDPAILPLMVARESVQLLDPTSAEAVTAAVEASVAAQGAPGLVIIDTLARCMGGDENSTEDMSGFVAALDRLRARFRCAVLVLHHSGLADKARSRGNTALRGAVDWEFCLSREGDLRRLHCTKVKDFEEPPALFFVPEVIGTGEVDPETGREIGSCVLRSVEAPEERNRAPKLNRAQRVGLEALESLARDAQGGHVSADAWRAEAYRLGISPASDAQARKKAFRRAVPALLDAGLVENADDYYWPAGTKGTAGVHVPQYPPSSGGTKGYTPLKEGVPCTPGPRAAGDSE